MIEIKSITHTVRLFATKLRMLDLVAPVMYCSYRGDKNRIPFYYKIIKGDSCFTDLTVSMDDMLVSMKSNTRNEIRRAEREGCVFSIVNDMDEFIPFYNDFCASKNLSDYVNRSRLAKYGDRLLLTKVMHNGVVLAMHANIIDPESGLALLILSSSQRLAEGVDRKLIGWGNRFLHFKELEYLKEKGYKIYDWSGVCLDKDNPCYSIGQFKLGFGGKMIDSWTLESPIYVFLIWIRARIRSCRSFLEVAKRILHKRREDVV